MFMFEEHYDRKFNLHLSYNQHHLRLQYVTLDWLKYAGLISQPILGFNYISSLLCFLIQN